MSLRLVLPVEFNKRQVELDCRFGQGRLLFKSSIAAYTVGNGKRGAIIRFRDDIEKVTELLFCHELVHAFDFYPKGLLGTLVAYLPNREAYELRAYTWEATLARGVIPQQLAGLSGYQQHLPLFR